MESNRLEKQKGQPLTANKHNCLINLNLDNKVEGRQCTLVCKTLCNILIVLTITKYNAE